MNGIWRRLRAALGVGVIWSIPWSLLTGSMVGLVFLVALRLSPGVPRLGMVMRAALAAGVGGLLLGFLAGTLFGLSLIGLERNNRIATLSLPRFAGWGALASAGLSGALVLLSEGNLRISGAGIFVGACTLLGAASAASSLLVARKGRDQELSLDHSTRSEARLHG